MNKIRFLLLGIVLIITAGCFGSNKDISFEFEIKNISSENVYVELTGIGVKDKLIKNMSSGDTWKMDIQSWGDEKGSFLYTVKIYNSDRSILRYSYNKDDVDAVEKIEKDFLLDEGKLSLQITDYLIK